MEQQGLRHIKKNKRHVLIYGCGSSAETQETKQISETVEMKVLRKINLESLRDGFISSIIRLRN
jgi:hypothetical protein